MLELTLAAFAVFVLFQILYLFVPLFTVKGKREFDKDRVQKGITILVPAYNEEKVILHCLQGIQSVNYSNAEAIIINDGSKDDTFKMLKTALKLEPDAVKAPENGSEIGTVAEIRGIYRSKKHPHIRVIDKENGGKADALNAGLVFASTDLIVTVDADSVLAPDALLAMNDTFSDGDVIAAGGTVHIGQGFAGTHKRAKPVFGRKGLINFQVIQYLTSFYLHRMTQAKFRAICVLSGAFAAFRRQAMIETGGYRMSVGEDMDMTLKIQMLAKQKGGRSRIVFVPEAVCYTECPEFFKTLFHQRIRWQKAFIDCVIHFRSKIFTKLGWPVSIYFIIEGLFLGTLKAFFVTYVIIMLIISGSQFMIAAGLLSLTFVLALHQGLATLVISRRYGLRYSAADYVRLGVFIPFEIITYRLLGLFFVTVGTVAYVFNRHSWHVTQRIGQKRSESAGEVKLAGK